jgi:hypothetical protein
MALASGVLEAQIMRRAELLRADKERSTDFIAKMRDRTFRCFAALEGHLPTSARPSTWRRSRRPSPAATTIGATAPTGAAPRRSSPPGTTRSRSGHR